MIRVRNLNSWLKTVHDTPKYTAFIKVAGIRIPKEIETQFRRAAAGEISHEDLRAEFMDKMGFKSG